MIWRSTVLMTIIDLLIILVSLASLWMLFIHRSKLIKSGLILGPSVVVAGLIAVGLFYTTDLFTMCVLPLLTTRAAAMTTMENLHLNYSWIVILVGTFSIFTGFAATGRRLLLMIDHLEKKTLELEREVAERRHAQEMLAHQAKELLQVNADLERFNRLAVGREERMIELKQQVNELLQEAGKPPAYDLSFGQGEKEHKRE